MSKVVLEYNNIIVSDQIQGKPISIMLILTYVPTAEAGHKQFVQM